MNSDPLTKRLVSVVLGIPNTAVEPEVLFAWVRRHRIVPVFAASCLTTLSGHPLFAVATTPANEGKGRGVAGSQANEVD